MSPRKIGKVLLLGAAGTVLLIGVLMLAVKLALDRVPRYQSQIKEWVYRQTGYHIAFAAVFPAFRWYGPELYLRRPELRSRDDRRVLARAAGGRVGLDLWQLLQNGKLFALRVELDSPDIIVDRLGPETFALASEIVLGGEHSAASRLTLNDLPAGRLVIRRGSISLRHWNADLPKLDLKSVDLDLDRVSNRLTARLSAQLPALLGGRLAFSGELRGGEPLDSIHWNGTANADGISFPGWRLLLPEYLTRLDAGSGGFQAMAQGRGATLERAQLEFGARGVVTLLSDGANTRLDVVSATLSLAHRGDRWTLLGRRVRVEHGGRRDPNSEFDVLWRDDPSGMLELTARANYLRAEALLPLVGMMPQKEIRDRLRELAPSGEWMDMRLALDRRSASDAWRFDARARFRDVGFAPLGRSPGLRGLSGELAGNETAGHVSLDSDKAVFDWPNQLPQPIELTRLKASIFWRRTPQDLLVATSDLALRTRAAALHGKLAWRQPQDGGSPVLTLASTVDNGNLGDARQYLPRELLPPDALAWLNRAFIAGRVPRADAIFEGPVERFPFRDGSGIFLVRFRVEQVVLDYRDGWPRIDNLAAQAEFRDAGMDVKILGADAAGLKVDAGEARFVDFSNGELEIHAAAHGDASAALGFLAATPLDAMAEHAFSSVAARGPLKTTVDLFFPFEHFDRRRVLVHVDLNGASASRSGSELKATELTGGADIDGAQVVHADLRGRVLGGAFQMTARAPRSRQVARTNLEFHGTMSGAALRAALSLPAGAAIGGQADYRAVLRMAPDPARERTLRISSTLSGLELGLPAPLDKAAGVPMPSALEIQWPDRGGVQLRFSLGSVLRGAVDSDAEGSGLGRAAVAFGGGEPAFSDAQPVNLSGSIGVLDLAGWLKLGAGIGAGTKRPLTAYLHDAALEVSRIDYLGLSFLDVSLRLARADAGWRIEAAGPNVAGSILVPGAGDPASPWTLDFQHLKLTDAPAAEAAPAAGAALDPRSIPPIDFHATELDWDDRQFGDVRATLVRRDDGLGLKQLALTNPAWSLKAAGDWRAGDGCAVHGTIESTDVGAALKQLGFAAVIEAKTGHVDFDLRWPGAPRADGLVFAEGQVKVALAKGQIIGLKPGAGRVLGLASIAELPRRLALDFSDLTDKGFAFDTAKGSFSLRGGSAYTDDVLVKGPAAEIGLIGRVGLKNHDYDQTAVVTGHVGGSLSFAAFAAGPVVGGAVLLFTQVFKQPLQGLVRGYYRITGTWDNPQVERIKSAEAPTSTAEAPKEPLKESPR